MSTEESEAPVDITQQATTPTPTTAPHLKNPKRVAAGKLIAEKTRKAREEQKKALADAEVIIANKRRKTQPRPLSQPLSQPLHHPQASAPPNGLWLAALLLGWRGFITNGKSYRPP